MLDRIGVKLGPVARARIERFGTGGDDPDKIVEALDAAGRRELVAFLRHNGPVGQFVTRHTRETFEAVQARRPARPADRGARCRARVDHVHARRAGALRGSR